MNYLICVYVCVCVNYLQYYTRMRLVFSQFSLHCFEYHIKHVADASLVPSSLNEEPSSSFSSSLVPTLQDTSFPSVGSETSNLDTETTSGGDGFAVSIMGSLAIMMVSTIASLALY